MKSLIFITITLVSIWSLNICGQNNIHFIHGLGSDLNEWSGLSNEITSNCVNATTFNYQYSSNNSIAGIRNNINTSIAANNSGGNFVNSIGIGHSLGGIILEEMQGLGNISSYITVGSPHQGADIANSLINGRVENYISSGCKEVFEDVIVALTVSSSPYHYFVLNFIDGDGSDFKLSLCESLIENVMSDLANPNWQTTNDLQTGTLNPSNATIPSIGIWSVEESPIHWRFFQTAIEENTSFNINLPNIVNKTRGIYETAEDVSFSGGIFYVITSLFNPFGGLRGLKLLWISEELEDAGEWLDGSESAYGVLIGAKATVSQAYATIEKWICNCVDQNGKPIPCPENGDIEPLEPVAPDQAQALCPNPDCWETIIVSHYLTILNNSDGFITEDSQLLPGALQNIRIDGVNHLEQSDNNAIWTAMSSTFTSPPDPALEVVGCVF